MASVTTPKLTGEEYLRLERQALEKSEYHDGEMFAMAVGTQNHSFISSRLVSMLDRNAPQGCRVFNSDLRIYIAAAKTFTYADGGLICGDPQGSSDLQDNILNPFLIAEVLSPSTGDYDRGKKFELYRTIESFREYLIVHQDRRCVEHHSRQDDGSWVLREYSGHGSSMAISPLGVQLSLDELYAKVVNID